MHMQGQDLYKGLGLQSNLEYMNFSNIITVLLFSILIYSGQHYTIIDFHGGKYRVILTPYS